VRLQFELARADMDASQGFDHPVSAPRKNTQKKL
jgi:hypothetical protein